MHVVEPRYNAAWVPFEARMETITGKRLAKWLNENERRDQGKRVIMTPQKSGNAIDNPPVLAALAAQSAWVSARSDTVPWGGPVVAAWPSAESLIKCVSRVGEATLTVFEWGKAPGVLGWATATGAFNAATGEPTPPLEPSLHDEFESMLFLDDRLSSAPKSGRDRRYVHESMRTFHRAGLDADFVVTYCIALGCTRDPRRVREHYRVANG